MDEREEEQEELLWEGLEPGTEYEFGVTSIGEEEERKSVSSFPIREETGLTL